MKRKFKCTVTRTDEYEIEFDENVIDKEFMDIFKRYFYNFDELEEHAQHIAQNRARFNNTFIEGYGIPLINGERPLIVDENATLNTGINIKIISEDDDWEVDVEEID